MAPPSTIMAAREVITAVRATTPAARSFGVVSFTGFRGPFSSGSGGNDTPAASKADVFPVSISTGFKGSAVAMILFRTGYAGKLL